jgi:hypothetical protein
MLTIRDLAFFSRGGPFSHFLGALHVAEIPFVCHCKR